MNQKSNISEFDKWVKESLQNASTPPPPGLWEGINAASSAAGAGTGGGFMSQIKEFVLQTLGWKAGIGALVVITAGTLMYSGQKDKKDSKLNEVAVQEQEMPAEPQVVDSPEFREQGKSESNELSGSTTQDSEIQRDFEAQNKEGAESGDQNPYDTKPMVNNANPSAMSIDPTHKSEPTDVAIHQRHGKNEKVEPSKSPSFQLKYEVDRKCDESIFEVRLDNGEIADWFIFTGEKWIQAQRDRLLVMAINGSEQENEEVVVKAKWNGAEATTTIKFEAISSVDWSELHNKQLLFKINGVQPEIAIWDFGDGSGPKFSQQEEIGHFYNYRKEPYKLSLIARYADGCIDTIHRMVQVPFSKKLYEPFIPNIFTPYNIDGKNDVFMIDIDSPTYYHLMIKNAMGKVVFESRDPSQAWNGRIHNRGNMCPQGKYVYALTYSIGNHPLEVKQNILYLR